MESIINTIVKNCLENNSINTDRLTDLICRNFMGEKALGIVAYLTEMKDKPELPEFSYIEIWINGKNQKTKVELVDYDPFRQEVSYSYIGKEIRFFTDKESANKYAQTGELSWKQADTKEHDEFTIESYYLRKKEGVCSVEQYIEGSKA